MGIAFIAFLGLLALVWVVLAVGPWHRNTFRWRLESGTPISWAAALPELSLIVPARNEAGMLPRTAPSWCGQNYPANLQVIIVDDQSEDDTPNILNQLRERFDQLTIVRASPRPPGWCGKPWAVHEGVAFAGGDLLLFTDADCVFHPDATAQAARFLLANDLDMLSLFPRVEFGSTWEELGMGGLVSVLALIMPIKLANRPSSSVALAAGGFILVRRQAYERIGGHEAVRSEIIEDVNLARKLKQSGARVHCRFTKDLVSTRMYEGFADMWEGLAKNAYAGMEYQPLKFWAGLLGAVIIFVGPPLYLAIALVALALHPGGQSEAMVLLAGVAAAGQIAVQARTVRYLKLPQRQCLAMPISAGLYSLIAISSAWQHHYGGGNLWKGRRYAREMLVGDWTRSGRAGR